MIPAYSYLRFSSPQQAGGDSVRRQHALRDGWLRRHPDARLDTSLRMADTGVSGFTGEHRKNPDRHALAAFLRTVEQGKVPRGAFLLIENLDRLSREHIQPALLLFLGLLQAGIRIVQLAPAEQVFDDKSDSMALMMAVMELSRGNSESQMKSVRVGAAWARKRREAGERVVTRRLPTWVTLVDGKLKLDAVKSAAVRRVYALALDGLGVATIARKLNAENVPVIGRTTLRGRAVRWSETTVYHLLTTRSAIGEYQPCRGRGGHRRPDGDPVPGYYPAVVTTDTFHAAQAALSARAKHGRGRRGAHVNLFSGLLRDARDGGTLTYKHLSGRSSSLIPVGAKHGTGAKWASFPAVPFEEAVLSVLVEVQLAEADTADGPERHAQELAGRLAEVDRLKALWAAKMDDPDLVDTVATKLAALTRQRKELAEQLAQARQVAATPLPEMWGQFRSLGRQLVKGRGDDATRERVRAALRQAVEGIYCLFTGEGRKRVAAVRVQFRETEAHRDYLIAYDPGRSNHRVKRPGAWAVRSFVDAGLPGLDLRKPADASKLERGLRRLAQQLSGNPKP